MGTLAAGVEWLLSEDLAQSLLAKTPTLGCWLADFFKLS